MHVRVGSTTQLVYSFLSLEWAFISDLDLLSDSYRCFGAGKFIVSAILRLGEGKKWSGKLSYLPPQEEPDVSRNHEAAIPTTCKYLPLSIHEPLPSNWKTIEGEFNLFWAVSASHMASDALVYPDAKFDDGFMYLVIATKHLGRAQMASIFLNIETGAHLNNKHIQVIKTRAYQLETFNPKDLMAVDGERFDASSPVQVRQVIRSFGHVYVDDKTNTRA